MEEVREKFAGNWKLDRVENIDEFMKAMGANFIVRKLACASRPQQTIEVTDNSVNVTTKTSFWKREEVMKVNEEYEHEEHGIKHKNFVKYENGTLTKDQVPIDASEIKPQKITRVIVDNEMLTTVEYGDIICKRWFKRLPN